MMIWSSDASFVCVKNFKKPCFYLPKFLERLWWEISNQTIVSRLEDFLEQ